MERFYVEQNGASWCVRDREIVYTLGVARGQPRRVVWRSTKEEAEQEAKQMNETRGHADSEPRCTRCGKQPAGGDPPMCAACHSLLAGD
ncbi:MAG TPA: hypothetical protein VEL69_04815 [Ktedonobacteraceae bacterium]|nr:hypothetical protein [Ktedonobacteraceae bacterium]